VIAGGPLPVRRCQFRLGTAVLLMLAAGLLLWLNFRPAFDWSWAIVTARQIRPLPEIELVDFRLGGTYAARYGWPWTARSCSWEIEPMLVVHPARIPEAWRQQALRERQADLTFGLETGAEFDRVLPGERFRPLRHEGVPRLFRTGADDEADAVVAWSAAGIVADAAVAWSLLLAVGIGAEWLSRRRRTTRRRPTPTP